MNEHIIISGQDYTQSLRGRKLNVYLMGEKVEEPVDHPMIRPSVNAMAKTYDLALESPELVMVPSPISNDKVNRFLHITTSVEDVVQQNKLQRTLGQLTGTCFQRCVGMDALNALYSVTYEIDVHHHTPYHSRLLAFIKEMQQHNYVIGGAMTDVKGDRSKSPFEQPDPDMYLHVCKRTAEGVYVRGAKPVVSIRIG
jgi:4-hydroxybutyryl-CoA dehydratase/vinylacetyl-CoA-Delta-isomerase